MKISANLVNKDTIVAGNWTVNKTITVKMEDPSVVPKDHTVSLRVVPCAITATTIPNMVSSIGD